MSAPVATCPRCRGTQITAERQGFGVGKAIVGGLAFGPVGLLAGNMRKSRVHALYLACGHSWTPGAVSLASSLARIGNAPRPQRAPDDKSLGLSVVALVVVAVMFAGFWLWYSYAMNQLTAMTDADKAAASSALAARIVAAYAAETGIDPADDLATALVDLLADLRHLCDREGLDFDPFNELAAVHHAAETAELAADASRWEGIERRTF